MNTHFNCQETKYNIFTFFLIVMPQYALLGASLACAVPLGLDQITEGSNTNLCAFIVWFTWTFPSGFGLSGIVVPVIYGCFHTQSAELNLITSLLPVFLLSLGLLLDFSFQHTLVQDPPSTNPVRLIFKVLKYAAKHRRATQRSAFTYCENEEPGRLDYGKSKYGGPFTTEQVEDLLESAHSHCRYCSVLLSSSATLCVTRGPRETL